MVSLNFFNPARDQINCQFLEKPLNSLAGKSYRSNITSFMGRPLIIFSHKLLSRSIINRFLRDFGESISKRGVHDSAKKVQILQQHLSCSSTPPSLYSEMLGIIGNYERLSTKYQKLFIN